MQKVWANMLSHISIFLGLVYTLFPSKLDIWLQKNLKSMSCTQEWSKSPWFSTTGKGKKMLCFCHWPLTCWLPYDYWWCSWQNGKKMLMLLKMIKKGKKADREKSCHHKVSIPVPSAWDKCYPLHHTCKPSLGLKTSFQRLDLISLNQNFQNIKSM